MKRKSNVKCKKLGREHDAGSQLRKGEQLPSEYSCTTIKPIGPEQWNSTFKGESYRVGVQELNCRLHWGWRDEVVGEMEDERMAEFLLALGSMSMLIHTGLATHNHLLILERQKRIW